MPEKALILVDLQNDFCPSGQLAVPQGDEVINIANQLQDKFDLIIATKDWHPKDHISFAENHKHGEIGAVIELFPGQNQILWPIHCIQETRGAAFHPRLDTQKISKVFYKGVDKNIDSYSAFFDNAHQRATGLGDYLHEHKVKSVYIMGLATDYCVKFSALDAAMLGFKVYVIKNGCRGVEITKGDIEKAYAQMESAGIEIISSESI